MKVSRYVPLMLLIVFGCGKDNYKEVISIKGEKHTVKIMSKSAELNVGINDIKVVVDPPSKLLEFYLYMPPMPGMPEMRAVADIKEKGKGVYVGKVSISMEGSWEIRAKVSGEMIRKEVNIPLRAGQEHAGMKHDMKGMKHDMRNVLTVPSFKLANFNVSTYKVDSMEVPMVIYAAGTVSYPSKNITNITPRFSGFITRVFADKEGEYIRKGEPLFEFYSPEIIRTYEEYINAKNNNDSLALRFAIEKFLLYGVLPEDIRDTLAIFRSPVYGRIKDVMIHRGMSFNKNTNLYTVVAGNIFYVIGEVSQSKAKYIRIGDIFEFDDVKAKIVEISPRVNDKTKTIRFVAVFQGKDFYEGMIVSGKIKRMVKGLFAPKDAVIRSGINDYVYLKVGENSFTPKKVKVLSEVEDGYIVEGIKVGDEIVSKGVFFIDAEANFRGIGGM